MMSPQPHLWFLFDNGKIKIVKILKMFVQIHTSFVLNIGVGNFQTFQ